MRAEQIVVCAGVAIVLLAVASSTMVGQSLRPTYSGPISVISELQTVVSVGTLQERTSPPTTVVAPSSSMDGTETGIIIGGVFGVILGGVLYTAAISTSESEWELKNMLLASLFFGLIVASIGGIVGSAGS